MKRALTKQELLDRYVHSVKSLLPPGKMDDIAAEIRSNLESLAEDRATQLGRELTVEEMSAILKQHGHPVVVAGRYRERPGRGLISPELFPLYWFTLRAIFGVWVTIRVIGAVFALLGTTPAGTILKYLGRDIMLAGFFIAAGVTLLFATWEYLELAFPYVERWKPESLPPVPPPVRQPRLKQPRAVIQIVAGVVILIFLAMALFSPWLFWGGDGRGVFSPSQALFSMRLLWWLLALYGISESWLRFTRFAAAEWRPLLGLTVSITGIALAVFLEHRGDLLAAGPNGEATSLATQNHGIAGFLVLVCVGLGVRCAFELRRLVRAKGWRWGGGRQTADSAS